MRSRFLDIMNLRDLRGSHIATPADRRDTRNMEVCRGRRFEKSGDSLKSCSEEWRPDWKTECTRQHGGFGSSWS